MHESDRDNDGSDRLLGTESDLVFEMQKETSIPPS